MRQALLQLQSRLPQWIGDVRGMGLMQAVEFSRFTNEYRQMGAIAASSLDESPVKGLARRVQMECLRRDMLLLKCSTFETLRFIPPLTVSEEEMAQGMEIFAEAVEQAINEK
jgi:4-aminobutyrate aminotransferase